MDKKRTAHVKQQRKAITTAVKNPPLQARTLLLLMTVIVFSALPHFLRVPLSLSGLIIAALSIKSLMLWRGKMVASKVLLLGLTAGVTALVFVHYGTINGHEAGSALLLGMLSLKLLEAKHYRDAMIAVFIAYFLCAVNFLFTQSIPTAAFMLVQVVLITYCLISVNQAKLNIPSRYRATLAAKTVVMGLPIMVVMFLLFPRIPGPLWGIPKPSQSAKTGFSEEMSPGMFSNLARSGAVAFRVRFKGEQRPTQNQLYWRGLTLWHYDGFTWNKGRSVPSRAVPFLRSGDALNYTVTIEPHNNKTLFTLDMPWQFKGADNLDRNYQLTAKRAITQVEQYEVSSHLNYRINTKLEPFERRKGLQLPDNYNPKTVALGQQWRAELQEPEAIVKHALSYFNQEAFFYTLQPPPLGKHKADDFLFNTRRGFCEYYSNAFVILMRAAGIPARVVVGYMGGETNPLNDNMTVRQSDAHAWAEVWLEEQGWVRVDPTAAVAPGRIEENLDAVLSDEDREEVAFTIKTNALRSLVNLWDAVDNSWNQWVLGYGPNLQKQFLQRFGLQDFMHFTYAMVAIIGLILLVTTYFLLRPITTIKPSPAQKLYATFCKRMAKQGYPLEAGETATAYIQRLSQVLPHQGQPLAAFAKTYNRLQYQPAAADNALLLEELRQQLKALK